MSPDVRLSSEDLRKEDEEDISLWRGVLRSRGVSGNVG